MNLNAYLTFDGNCREAFEFYRKVFGGSSAVMQTLGEGPDNMPVPDDKKDQIMHVSLAIGDSTLMGSDNPFGPPVGAGANFSLSVNADNREECDRLFGELSQNGEVLMDLQETFWGAYFGQCKDQFGIKWMLNCEQQTQ